jgi:hypothetical protein
MNKKHVAKTEIHRDNIRVDALAKCALVEGITSNTYISSDFPFELVRVHAGSKKLTGPLRPFITSHQSRRIARDVYGYGKRGKKLIGTEDFDHIFWEIIPKALTISFPSSFKDWLLKHVTGCSVSIDFSRSGNLVLQITVLAVLIVTTKTSITLPPVGMRDGL